jgi:polar amino acid transport system substrate-binding protein
MNEGEKMRPAIIAVTLSMLLLLPAIHAHANSLDFIRASRTLAIGVKTVFAPFGFRDPEGTIVGFEPDLAADIAQRLGVELQLVPVTTSNRMQMLQQGKIDVMIATLAGQPDRRKAVQMIEPFYYADFVNILLRKDAAIMKWDDLKGKAICGTNGSFQKQIGEKQGIQIQAFDGTANPLEALEGGTCLGYIYSQNWIIGKLMDRKWRASYEMPLAGVVETPWAIAVRKDDERLRKVLEDISANWAKATPNNN